MFAAILFAGAIATHAAVQEHPAAHGIQSMLEEESPDVFLAKATLQQYLSRVVREDWDGARRLTHPKALAVIDQTKRRTGLERHALAPWADRSAPLKTFRFEGAREVSPGVVLVQVGEDRYRAREHGMSVDDPAVYILFKSRGGFLIADRKPGCDVRPERSSGRKIQRQGARPDFATARASKSP